MFCSFHGICQDLRLPSISNVAKKKKKKETTQKYITATAKHVKYHHSNFNGIKRL